jgi:hypothetical protein
MDNYNETELSNKGFELYNFLKIHSETYPDIQQLLKIANDMSVKLFYNNDELNGFMILFSFDYFHITHLCICDIFNNDRMITKINMDFLMKNIYN